MIKLIKTKTHTTTEEIEIKEGVYYFSCGYKNLEPYIFKKVSIVKDGNFDDWEIEVHTVKSSYDDYMLRKVSSYETELPFSLEDYFGGQQDEEKEYKPISEKEFEKIRKEVKEKL